MSGEWLKQRAELSEEGAYFAYCLIADYESSQALRCDDPKNPEVKNERIVLEALQNTDYLYIATIPLIGDFEGLWFGYERKWLQHLMHQAMLAGYNPPGEVRKSVTSDFMWDEILNSDINDPAIWDIITGSSSLESGDRPPTGAFARGNVLPRGEALWLFGRLYDIAAEYKSWGWGYPRWSEKLEVPV